MSEPKMSALELLEKASGFAKLASDANAEYGCISSHGPKMSVYVVTVKKGADPFFITRSFMESLVPADD